MSQPTEKASKQTITAYQAFALIYSTILGVGILSLPRDMAETVGNDMVWVIIMSGLIVGVLLYFITWLCQRFPRQTMVQFFPQILGSEKNPKVGRILSIPFFILIGSFWLISVASVARIFGESGGDVRSHQHPD